MYSCQGVLTTAGHGDSSGFRQRPSHCTVCNTTKNPKQGVPHYDGMIGMISGIVL